MMTTATTNLNNTNRIMNPTNSANPRTLLGRCWAGLSLDTPGDAVRQTATRQPGVAPYFLSTVIVAVKIDFEKGKLFPPRDAKTPWMATQMKNFPPHAGRGGKAGAIQMVSTEFTDSPWTTAELASLLGLRSAGRAKERLEKIDELVVTALAPQFVERGTRPDQATASIRAQVARLHQMFQRDERTSQHVTQLIKVAAERQHAR